ncbi:sulfite exporter TauE/SafE family protein [Saprospira sp. CCB-QB6]|uniref:sulfite exporter TauE/SafE family protein n=1 Tax=Saprospira sp. CCB-QB6 TaxID=3023936 RepID=UPI00234C0020|nr:sulfite exporter TauE/SafE family protein [Saprospira sp. CCB-QB6]WCL80396.1 sulfite exporter TauE/SafE family protein [Saprospira sp. CCB-QB6]
MFIFIGAMAVIFLASLIKSTFGFGEGMVNMSLLTLLLGLDQAVPLVAILALGGSAYILLQDFKQVDWKELWPFLIGALLAAPIGLSMGEYLPAFWMRKLLGLLIMVFAVFKLYQSYQIAEDLGEPKGPEGRKWGYLFGLLGGLFGGAYNVAGPAGVLYGNFRAWPPAIFRVTMQGYFMLLGIAVVSGHAYMGRYSPEVLKMAAFALIPIALGVFLGRFFNQKLSNPALFNKLVYFLLILLGLILIIK